MIFSTKIKAGFAPKVEIIRRTIIYQIKYLKLGGKMSKIFQTKRRQLTFFSRLGIVFWGAIVITYTILWASLQYGYIGLFFGGMIAGGLWGEFWHMVFDKDAPGRKWLPKKIWVYILLNLFMLAILILLLVCYPLPAI